MPFVPDAAPDDAAQPPKSRFVPDAVAPPVAAAPPAAAPRPPRSGLEHAGDVLNVVKEHPFTALPGILENGVSGITSGVGSLVEAVTGQDPGSVDLAYRPRTDAGKKIAELGGEEAAHIGAGYDKVAGTGPLAQTLKERVPQAAAAVSTVTGAHAGFTGAKALASDAAKVGTVEGAANVRGGTPIERGRALGYKFRPSDVLASDPSADVPGLKREGLKAPNDMRRDTTLENQVVTTREAANDIGAEAKNRIDPKTFDKLREPHQAVYDQVGRAVQQFQSGTELDSALNNVVKQRALDPKARRAVAAQVEQYRKTDWSGPEAMKDISALRRRATAQMRSDDVSQMDLGIANRGIANALEEEVGRQLKSRGVGTLEGKFQEARTSLAKIHDVQSVTKGGQVDAQGLARLKTRGVPLTGRLNEIADIADAAPSVMRHSSKATGVGNSVKADSFYGAVKNVAKGAAHKFVPGMDVMSDRFQSKHFGREATPTERSYLSDSGKPQPKETPRPQQGGQDEMFGRAFEMKSPAGVAPERIRPGALSEQLGIGIGEPLNLQHAPGVTPERVWPGHIVEQPPIGLGEPLHLQPAPGTTPARSWPPTLSNQLGIGIGEPLELQAAPGRVGRGPRVRPQNVSGLSLETIDQLAARLGLRPPQ